MAASGKAMAVLAACTLIASSGCVSTQQKNARAKLRATRMLDSRRPQRVVQANPDVRVEQVALVRGSGSAAVVVDLRSSADEPLTDLPIAVGVRTPGGRRVLLNDRRGQAWFQTHVPAIAAGARATWVYTVPRRAARRLRGRPFAIVGATPQPAISHASALPKLVVAAAAGNGGGRGARGGEGASARAAARVVVTNDSDVPQDDVQVYALVREGRRYVAAGKAAIPHLDAGAQAHTTIPLSGPTRSRAATVHAIPTIFE